MNFQEYKERSIEKLKKSLGSKKVAYNAITETYTFYQAYGLCLTEYNVSINELETQYNEMRGIKTIIH